MLTIELFAHMDAGDRRLWTADQDTRPLSPLGRAQAERLCLELAATPFDALYSSTALRCIESIQPLAALSNLAVQTLPGLHETDGWLPPPAWQGVWDQGAALGAAYAVGAAMRDIGDIRAAHPAGRVAVCTHGDVLPAVVMYLAGAYRIDLPAPNQTRGGWYTLLVDDQKVDIRHHDVLPGFPLQLAS